MINNGIIESDTIIDGSNQWMVKVETSKFVVWEITGCLELCKIDLLSNEWLSFDKNFVIFTGYKEWLWVRNRKSFLISSGGVVKKCFIGKIISYKDVVKMFGSDNTFIKNILTEEVFKGSEEKPIPMVHTIYAKCKDSMEIMDRVHRDYVTKHVFESNQIMSIEAVAGSGKTSTLIELMKKYRDKKILYIAFNKSLVVEIGEKIKNGGLTNVFPKTFDSLMRDLYILKKGDEPRTIDLKPQNIGHFIDFFNGKNYKLKKYYCGYLSKFCNNIEYNDIKEYCMKTFGVKKDLLEKIWTLVLNDQLITFDTIRKFAFMNHWAKDELDKKYDLILIDEAQDFDMVMLKILLDDTTIPKVFVGDPRQAIYQFRGCINAFEHLPESTFKIEFYSTFRLGPTACSSLEKVFPGLHILSKQQSYDTVIDNHLIGGFDKLFGEAPYVYLFRSWRNLLLKAQGLKDCWIYQFDKQIVFIQQLHEKLSQASLTENDLNEFSDDLPKFLLTLSSNDLLVLIDNIKKNLVNDMTMAKIMLYTIHSYKGLENDYIRVCDDIDLKEESNLYYVALTRGKKMIIKDGDLFPPINVLSIMKNKKELICTKENKIVEVKKEDCMNRMNEQELVIKKMDELLNEKVFSDTTTISYNLFISGKSINQISQLRSMREETIRKHLIKFIPDKFIHWSRFMDESEYNLIKTFLDKNPDRNIRLKEIKDNLPKNIDYNKIEIAKEWIFGELDYPYIFLKYKKK